jgi:16S rRNA (cytidine1402-2'-O)-methyltransferase
VIVVAGAEHGASGTSADVNAALAMVEALVRGGTSRADAAKAVAAATGIPRRSLYQAR